MNKGAEKVSLVRCGSYSQKNVDRAVRKAFSLADVEIPRNKKVFVKPNIVGYFGKNQWAITTHPSIVEAVCKILKEKNCRIFIGDSSFINPEISVKKSGIEAVAKKYGAKLVILEQEKQMKVVNKNGPDFYITHLAKDSDLIINIPKLKTHQLEKYTGAIKNLFGLVPGGEKQSLHAKAPNEKKFSQLLVDIYEKAKPQVNLMDAIIGMEGRGPTAGKPKKVGYILASKNSVSLDVASSMLMGYRPKNIFAIKYAIKRKLGSYEFLLISEDKIKKIPNFHFEKPEVVAATGIKGFLKFKPIVADKNKCIKCGLCVSRCPKKAITLNPFPEVDRRKCIRCFCCMEVCPQHALSVKG